MHTGRIITEHKASYVIRQADRDYVATVRGSFFDEGAFPKVGDFVRFDVVAEGKAVIEEILPRRTTIARRAVGVVGEQVIVANVDVMFIVIGLDGDFHLSRLERYLLLAEQSGVAPVVVLNKVDVVDEVEEYVAQVTAVSGGAPVHAVSAREGIGMEALREHIGPDTTVVLLGSSGAGKSTIANWLFGKAVQAVSTVRADDSRGRHTTTTRQLFTLPGGGYLIDTPGMRELGVESGDAAEEAVFTRIEDLALQCRFTNCDHEKSSGCAVVAAVKAGEVTERQYQNYLKLQRERRYAESTYDESASREYTQTQKKLHQRYHQAQPGKRTRKSFS